jgi:hypothetical protein
VLAEPEPKLPEGSTLEALALFEARALVEGTALEDVALEEPALPEGFAPLDVAGGYTLLENGRGTLALWLPEIELIPVAAGG